VGASETLRTIARCEYSSLQGSVGSKRVGEKQSGNERGTPERNANSQ